jgi:ABC-type cobalamin/Fe3+-siderophores transport system ATPase subunit
MTGPVLEVTNLEVRRDGTDVLRGVSLAVEAGEVVAVLGPNGAGKSTLLETVAGVHRAVVGTVACDGRAAMAMQSSDLAARSAQANVELALAWWGSRRGDRRPRAQQALAEMGASHLADRDATRLSGGERRRVHLARAIAVQPDLLLLDEPFAGLDPASRAAILEDTGAAVRRNARAVLLVLHDRAEAWALADRIVVLIDGHVAAEGPPREVLERPPTPQVARFLGFNGEIRSRAGVVLTRTTHVVIDPAGDVQATITRLMPLEDGARADLEIDGGSVSTLVPVPGPVVGDRVRIRVVGGIRFPTTEG